MYRCWRVFNFLRSPLAVCFYTNLNDISLLLILLFGPISILYFALGAMLIDFILTVSTQQISAELNLTMTSWWRHHDNCINSAIKLYLMIKRGDQIQLYLFNYFAYFLVAALLITSYFVQGSLAQGEHNFTVSEFTWETHPTLVTSFEKKHKKLRVSFILLTLVKSNRSASHPDTKNYPKFKFFWSFGTN